MGEVSKAEQALKLLDGAEQSCPGAIEELLAQREEIDAKLARLKRLGVVQPSEKNGKREVKCTNCGEVGHNARGCKTRAGVPSAQA